MYLSETCESLSWGSFCWMSWKFYVDIIGNLTIGRPRFGSWFISNNLYLKCNYDTAVRRIMDPVLLPGEMIVHFLHAHTHTYTHTLTHTSMRACTHTGLRQWMTPPLNDSGTSTRHPVSNGFKYVIPSGSTLLPNSSASTSLIGAWGTSFSGGYMFWCISISPYDTQLCLLRLKVNKQE